MSPPSGSGDIHVLFIPLHLSVCGLQNPTVLARSFLYFVGVFVKV